MLLVNSVLSSILGWVSIACWIIVYSPQIWENYVLQSGEGVSVAFVIIWLAGDLTNLFGAIITHLLPTVIILAIYFSLCDLVLLLQIYYYRRKKSLEPPSDQEPLLPRDVPKEPVESATVIFIRYTACLLFVFATGAIAWVVSNAFMEKDGSHPQPDSEPLDPVVAFIGQVLGWTSAVLFLGARIPQILKNLSTKCEGLSPALFFFSILGNLTYGLSILTKSTEREYIIRNSGWLAGSLLTVFLDLIVISQFIYYRAKRISGPTTSAIRGDTSA